MAILITFFSLALLLVFDGLGDSASPRRRPHRSRTAAAFATEGDPWPEHGKTRLSATNKNNDGTPAAAIAAASASFDPVLGEFDPYVHTIDDRMDVDDSTGVYSIPHALEFSKYAVAFAVEQAGWDEGHTREDDGDGRKVNKR